MPPLPPQHLLPHVLQMMPRKLKYDQFQSKGHHNEENPQSMTKMSGNLKIVPKLENQETVAIISLVLTVISKHQHAKLQAISSIRSQENARKPQI